MGTTRRMTYSQRIATVLVALVGVVLVNIYLTQYPSLNYDGSPTNALLLSESFYNFRFGSSWPEQQRRRGRPPVPLFPFQDDDAVDLSVVQGQHKLLSLANLSCQAYGGPHAAAAAEMVYWKEIPEDATYMSPLRSQQPQYLTLEPDEGGFNNIRMAFETAVALAVATGRILVLPPKMGFYLLNDVSDEKTIRHHFGLEDFYDLPSMAAKQYGAFQIMSFQEFLEREALTGHLLDQRTGQPTFPPQNRTNWDGFAMNMLSFKENNSGRTLWDWLRSATLPIDWEPTQCIVGIPDQPGEEGIRNVMQTFANVQAQDAQRKERMALKNFPVWRNRYYSFDGNPVPVDGSPDQRMSEMLADRTRLCLYDERFQQARVIHIKGEEKSGSRMLIHHYAFLFHQSWQQQIWMQRFIRDHFRYKDALQCAAARIVHALRGIARLNGDHDHGFDSMHVRRGDFQFGAMWISARDMYDLNTRKMLEEDRVLYIATDEKDKSFFKPLQKHYHVYFLDDFVHLLPGIDTHYFGMIDQLVAARGETFVGTYMSTFTGFINRMRGYHAQAHKTPGYLDGFIDSYYYAPQAHSSVRKAMRKYAAVEPPFWHREYAVAWRDIDHNVQAEPQQESVVNQGVDHLSRHSTQKRQYHKSMAARDDKRGYGDQPHQNHENQSNHQDHENHGYSENDGYREKNRGHRHQGTRSYQ